MLRLNQKREDRWLELDKIGVRILIRPLDTAVITAARNDAAKRIAALWAEEVAAAESGFPSDPTGPNFANPSWRSAMQQQFFAASLLRVAAKEWVGVLGEDGEPAPIDPATTEAFAAHDEASHAFLAEALTPVASVSAEGNASAPSSPGAGDGGATTAPDAATTVAPPAPLS